MPGITNTSFTAIPYFANANRQPGEMMVWMAEKPAAALPSCHLAGTQAQEARITVEADQTIGQVSRLLTGACIEDVNHEIYGGIYSQMIFGESFQEPPVPVPPKGFRAFGGSWRVTEGVLEGSAGDGPILASPNCRRSPTAKRALRCVSRTAILAMPASSCGWLTRHGRGQLRRLRGFPRSGAGRFFAWAGIATTFNSSETRPAKCQSGPGYAWR